MIKFPGRFGLILATLAILSVSAFAQDRSAMVVSPAWLASHIHDPNLVLLHVGANGEFETGHIPGAHSVALMDISTPSQPGQLSLELPSPDLLKVVFEKLGISDDSRVVVYFGKDWVTPTTRVIFTLAYMGLGDRTSLLDGGMPAWVASGGAVTPEVTPPSVGKLTPHPNPELVVDAAWISSHLHQPSVSILDVREAGAFRGDDAQLLANPRVIQGHIPGAASVPMEILTDESGKLKTQSEIAAILSGAGIKPGSQVVSYCWVGQRATLDWFVARLYGYDSRLYDGSWQDWTRHKDLPIEMPPGDKKDPAKN